MLSESDNPSGGPAQSQCFAYDYLGRLAQAWSQGSSDCSSGPSQSAEAGAAAPYWEDYSYNTVGDLTGETSTPASGAATATTDSYPAAGSAQPHAVSAVQSTGPAGTTSASYGYTPSGQLTSVTGTSGDESPSWDDQGRLSSVTVTPAGSTTPQTTSYLYDADGNLLIQEDPGTVTLYLGDEQLVLDTATGAVTGTRYYSIGGTTIAARTSSGNVDYLIGDQQDTSLLSIDANTGAVTRRYYDPYGNPIGTQPSAWPGTRGFVGGTADPSTDLTNLGAREYDPGNSSFISPDPLVSPYDPQDLDPYAYAEDNPTTNEDPSGQRLNAPAGSCEHNACSGVNWGPNPSSYPKTQGNWGYQASPEPSEGCPPVPFVCGGSVVPGFSGSGWVPKGTASPPPPPQPEPVVRKITNGDPASQFADCGYQEFWRGACPSERAAAGSTPQQVRQSFIGAGAILSGAILGPLLGALGAAAAEDENEYVNLASEARTQHVLNGDQTGGGHLWPGLAGKTPFPEDWSGAQVMHAISDVATSPESSWTVSGSRAVILGNYDGMNIRVIYDLQNDDIVTGYPTNLSRNP